MAGKSPKMGRPQRPTPGGPLRHDLRQDRNLGPVRSALRLRLALALFGLAASVAGLVLATVVTWHLRWAVLFGVLVGITALNVVVVSIRIAQRRRYPAPHERTGDRREG